MASLSSVSVDTSNSPEIVGAVEVLGPDDRVGVGVSSPSQSQPEQSRPSSSLLTAQ